MFEWEWECFEEFLGNATFGITDVGPLRAPIRTFEVRRDEKLGLVMETRAEQDSRSNATVHPLGTVRINSDSVTFSGTMGTIVARGVQPLGCSAMLSENPAEGELRELSSINSLEGTLPSSGKDVVCVIEWLANLNDSFVWPHFTEDEVGTVMTRRLHDGVNGLNLKSSSKGASHTTNCVKFAIDGHDIYLATSKSHSAKHVPKPGFLVFIGNPSAEFRKKILDCISFALGLYLVRLGSSSFDEDWSIVSFHAVNAYSLGGKAFEQGPLPPAPLGLKYQLEIDPPFLSRMVASLHAAYDTLRFGSLCWAYWHATCATPHIAAAHFGAAIEALQASYLETHKGAIKTVLVGAESWATLSKALDSTIAGLVENEETRTILKNKAGDFNKPPHGVITERLLEILHLTLGEREKKAWKRRNDAGHGNEIDPDGYVELIRDIKLLRIRFHKMIFAMTGASELYHDYFSINHPTRKLSESIP